MCSDETMNKGLSSSVGNRGRAAPLCDPRSTTPNTHGPSDTLPLLYLLLVPNFDSSISTVFPKPPSLIPAFRTLLEQIVPQIGHTVGFERLVSRAILLPKSA